MPHPSATLDAHRLVPLERLGSVLHRARVASGESLAAVARRSGGRFLPDDLVAVERGQRALADDEVADLVALHELTGPPVPAPTEVELVLDRSVRVVRPGDPAPVLAADPAFVAARLVALCVLLGVDVTTGAPAVAAFAEAVGRTERAAVDLVHDVLADDPAAIAALAAATEARVAVPAAGLLVADTDAGSLVMVGRGPDGRDEVGCAPLGELISRRRR